MMTGANRHLSVKTVSMALAQPFTIAGYVMTTTDVVRVSISQGEATGQGEASGVYYRVDEDVPGMLRHIESVRGAIEKGADRDDLLTLLHPGGARNALDCALWDLEANVSGVPAWQAAGLAEFSPLRTTFTVPVAATDHMATCAQSYAGATALKLKLNGDGDDAKRIVAVRAACPTAWIGVDANQSLTEAKLDALLPTLLACNVELVEQPFPIGNEAWLDDFDSFPVPIAADESMQGLNDCRRHAARFAAVNIKLDKCGGLTEGLAIAREAKERGCAVMVGNTIGSSLAMVPAMVLGQLCDIVDLDGPIFLADDYRPGVHYDGGNIHVPANLWGGCTT